MGDGCPHQFSREPCGVGARPGAQPGALRSGTFQAGQGEPRPQACFAAAAPRRDWEEGEQPRLAGGGPGEHSRAAAEPLCPALVAAVERDPPLPASIPSAPSLPWAPSRLFHCDLPPWSAASEANSSRAAFPAGPRAPSCLPPRFSTFGPKRTCKAVGSCLADPPWVGGRFCKRPAALTERLARTRPWEALVDKMGRGPSPRPVPRKDSALPVQQAWVRSLVREPRSCQQNKKKARPLPALISLQPGGCRETTAVWTQLQTVTNPLGTAKLLMCADPGRGGGRAGPTQELAAEPRLGDCKEPPEGQPAGTAFLLQAGQEQRQRPAWGGSLACSEGGRGASGAWSTRTAPVLSHVAIHKPRIPDTGDPPGRDSKVRDLSLDRNCMHFCE